MFISYIFLKSQFFFFDIFIYVSFKLYLSVVINEII